ncbi:TPA: hypothetical protein L1206_004495 [Escherichia coli]|nr:hypothetical protein [Escherichia coli]HBN2121971.1 hypothetical protein [Escherichia coli]
MSRTSKKKNVIEVISRALQTQPGRQAVASSKKLYEMEAATPGELLIFTLETDSPELTDHELELIQSMGPGVYFRVLTVWVRVSLTHYSRSQKTTKTK